ncbi:MAG: terminase TerL endonuclease subunit, partial [Clostridia bacterium]
AWGALYLMSSLSQDYEVVDVKMSYRYFSPSVKSFRERIYDGRIKHEFNPILNFCVANAVTKSDLQENILLDKKKSVNRIDLLVSAIIAYNEFVEEETSQEFGDYFLV